MRQKYVATVRITFEAEDEVEALVTADDLAVKAEELLEDDDTLTVTQVIPLGITGAIEPQELVERMKYVGDSLVATRIRECYDLASWMYKVAWILEHRTEESFDLGGYDYGEFVARAAAILKKGRKDGG